MFQSVPQWFSLGAITILGLLFGSFANVVIWRLPRGESLSHPASHCPKCGNPVRWFDNIPVMSWLVLRGRCRDCGTPISWRYPVVELLSGVLWAACAMVYGITAAAAFAIVFTYLLLILGFIDLDVRRLPNILVGMLAAIGVAGVVVTVATGLPACPLTPGAGPAWLSGPIGWAIAGTAVGAALPAAVAGAYWLVRRRQGLGMGDIKLLAAMGPFLGLYVVMVFFGGAILGSIAALAGLAGARTDDGRRSPAMAFGPWLASAGVLIVLWGPAAWRWYAGLVGLG